MGKIYDSILELTGHTPLVRLHQVEKDYGVSAALLAKLEYFNPAGSVKDRIALEMIEAAEREGKLKPGGTIVEATGGNTGIGLASVAARKGYSTVIVMPGNMSQERIDILEGYGAQVELTPADLYMPGAGARAAELAAEIDGAFMPTQSANPNNPLAHYKTTGPEIWEDTDGKIDIFVSAIGTGGTITGVGAYLKERNPAVEIIAVEPADSAVLSGGKPGLHRIQGIGGGFVPPILNRDIYSEVITVTDKDAFELARVIAKSEGMSVGISSGATLWAALQVAKRAENTQKNIVFLLPDAGERYLSSGLYYTKAEKHKWR